MYGVVLMAAMTASSASTGHWFHHHRACHGCHGGWGYTHYSGNFCHGCYGYPGCHGCAGGGFTVYAPAVQCQGTFGCAGCYGAYGGWTCYGVPLPHHGYWNECPPAEVISEKRGGSRGEQTPEPRKRQSNDEQARARVTIDVPAEAKVYVDGKLMKSTGTRRVIQTPVLQPGEAYFYDVRVEMVRDGRTVVESQRVVLRPGRVVAADFSTMNQNLTATAQGGR